MESRLLFIMVIAIAGFLFISGCASKTSEVKATSENSTQPQGQPVPRPPVQTCPPSCDDQSYCTNDICNSATNFKCTHEKLNGPQGTCSGDLSNCQEMTCVEGICLTRKKISCCGDGKIDEGETCRNCPEDVKCNEGQNCCLNSSSIEYQCTVPTCKKDSDCNDNNRSTNDTCIEAGCLTHCQHNEITECKNGDGACPQGCNTLIDSDCPAHPIGVSTEYGEYRIQLKYNDVRHCETRFHSGYIQDWDFGYYVVFDLTVENIGNQSGGYIGGGDFRIVDSQGNQYRTTSGVAGESCNDQNMFESDSLYPGVTRKGELWFDLGNGNDNMASGKYKLIYDLNSYETGDELVFVGNN